MLKLENVLVFINVFIYASYTHLFLSRVSTTQIIGISGIKPLYWYLFTVATFLYIVIKNKFSALVNIPHGIWLWIWIFLIQGLIWYLISGQSIQADQALVTDYITVSALLFILIVILNSAERVKIARIALLAVALSVIPGIVSDFFDPLYTKVEGRAAGVYVNPNVAGEMIVLIMIGSLPLIPRKLSFWYCIVMGLVVLITFSRTSITIWIVAMVGLSIGGIFGNKNEKPIIAIGGIVVIIILALALFSGEALRVMESIGMDRYLTDSTRSRISGLSEAVDDKSADDRLIVARGAWDKIKEKPFLGHGIGYAKEWEYDKSTHNTYLLFFMETGITGLILVLALLVILWNNTDYLGKIMTVVFGLSSMATDSSLRQVGAFLFVALIAVSGRSQKNRTAS